MVECFLNSLADIGLSSAGSTSCKRLVSVWRYAAQLGVAPTYVRPPLVKGRRGERLWLDALPAEGTLLRFYRTAFQPHSSKQPAKRGGLRLGDQLLSRLRCERGGSRRSDSRHSQPVSRMAQQVGQDWRPDRRFIRSSCAADCEVGLPRATSRSWAGTGRRVRSHASRLPRTGILAASFPIWSGGRGRSPSFSTPSTLPKPWFTPRNNIATTSGRGSAFCGLRRTRPAVDGALPRDDRAVRCIYEGPRQGPQHDQATSLADADALALATIRDWHPRCRNFDGSRFPRAARCLEP